MKTNRLILFAAFLVGCVLWASSAQCLITITGDQMGRSGITVVRTDQDDENDADQNFTEHEKEYIKIDNWSRRYLGVYIQRKIGSGWWDEIDNGPNDELIGKAYDTLRYETLEQYFKCALYRNEYCGPPPSSRRYILPVGDEAFPGMEVKFLIRTWGPAALKFPPDDIEPGFQEKEARLLNSATAWTVLEEILVPCLQLLIGEKFDASLLKPDDWASLNNIANEFSNFIGRADDLGPALKAGDYMEIVRQVLSFFTESTSVKLFVEKYQARYIGKDVADLILGAQQILLIVDQVDLANAILQLSTCNWLEEYEFLLVIPEVETLEPSQGAPGDIVTITGKGFDPYEIQNNHAFFTGSLSAEVIEVPDSNTLKVRVPDSFDAGPVQVCVSGYCSNSDVLFSIASIRITNPTAGSTVTGTVNVAVEVLNAPSPFPLSEASLYVDNTLKSSSPVSSPSFSFSLDTADLTDGQHALKVELTMYGYNLQASVDITVQHDGSGEYPTEFDFTGICELNRTILLDTKDKRYVPINLTFKFAVCEYSGLPSTYYKYQCFGGSAILEKYECSGSDCNYYPYTTLAVPGVPGKTARLWMDATTSWKIRSQSYTYYLPTPPSCKTTLFTQESDPASYGWFPDRIRIVFTTNPAETIPCLPE